MEYTKIRLDFKYAEKGRFYRTVLVRSDLDLESIGIYKPWNFDIDKYSEFDNPLDIETLNEELDFDEVFENEE